MELAFDLWRRVDVVLSFSDWVMVAGWQLLSRPPWFVAFVKSPQRDHVASPPPLPSLSSYFLKATHIHSTRTVTASGTDHHRHDHHFSVDDQNWPRKKARRYTYYVQYIYNFSERQSCAHFFHGWLTLKRDGISGVSIYFVNFSKMMVFPWKNQKCWKNKNKRLLKFHLVWMSTNRRKNVNQLGWSFTP